MKKTNIIIVLVLILAIVAFISKPSERQCRDAVADSKMQDYNTVLFEGLARKMVNKGIIIKDYIFLKQIKFAYDGSTKTLGWGAFGQVFINRWRR